MEKITINNGACGLRVYSKEGFDFSVGVRQTSPSSVDFFTIDDGEEPKYFITITDKNGGDITDDVILSHVEIFFDNK